MDKTARQRWPGVWQGRHLRPDIPALPSGYRMLDQQLPSRGWPQGALTELLLGKPGSGELSLLLPALAKLTQQAQWVMMVDPPWIPYPPALVEHGLDLERLLIIRTRSTKESLWACEQALRGYRGGALLSWTDNPGFARLRRLHLAARSGHKLAFLFRPHTRAEQPSPAALRLHVQANPNGCQIRVLKCQGHHPRSDILVRQPARLMSMTASVPGAPVSRHAMPDPPHRKQKTKRSQARPH